MRFLADRDVESAEIKVQSQVQSVVDVTSRCGITFAHDELGLKDLTDSFPGRNCKDCASERICLRSVHNIVYDTDTFVSVPQVEM